MALVQLSELFQFTQMIMEMMGFYSASDQAMFKPMPSSPSEYQSWAGFPKHRPSARGIPSGKQPHNYGLNHHL